MVRYALFLIVFLPIFCGSSHNSIIPVKTEKDIEKGIESNTAPDTDDQEVIRHSLAYCFKERYKELESYVSPFMGNHVQRLRAFFISTSDTPASHGSGSSSQNSGYGTPICRSDSSTSVSLNSEVDNTIKEAVADSLKETLESYEKRMHDLEHRVMIQNALLDAQDNATTPRERKRALIITSCTALGTTIVTAVVTYLATSNS